MTLFDTHNHGAWEIDDGMPSKEDCKKMLLMASEDGIHNIIATPHMVPGKMDAKRFSEINKRVQEYKELAKEYNVCVYPGCEIFLNFEYLSLIDSKHFNTLADSNYILAEFDVRKDIQKNKEAEDYLYELKVRGYQVVLAHVERYFHMRLDTKRVQQWVLQGCYVQVNRTSLMGLHGEMNKRNARQLLKEGLVHIVASDAHRTSGQRVCILSDAYDYIKKKYGEENAQRLMQANPQHIINNEPLDGMIRRQSLFNKMWKRGA